MEFVVDRKTWLRGVANGSQLLNSYGKRCCLGFLAQQCQIPDTATRSVGLLCSVDHNQQKKLPSCLLQPYSSRPQTSYRPTILDIHPAAELDELLLLEGVLADINDNSRLTDQEREAELTKLFAANGIMVTFEN